MKSAQQWLSDLAHPHWQLGLRASGVLGLRVSSALLAFLSTLLVTRLFGAAWAGTFFLSVAVVTVCATLAQLGIDLPLMRTVAVAKDQENWSSVRSLVRRAQLIGLAAGAALTVSVIALSPWAGRVLSDASLDGMLRIMALAIVPYTLILLMARALSAIERPALAELIHRTAFQVGFIALTVTLSLVVDELALGIAFTIAYWIVLILGRLIWGRASGAAASRTNTSSHVLLKPGAPLLLATALFLTINWSDTLMIGYFRSSESVGVYGVATRVATTMTMILATATAVFAPRFAALYKRGESRALERLARKVAAGSVLAGLPMMILLVTFPGTIMSFFGEEFVPGATALLILTTGQFVNVAIGMLGPLLAMANRESRVLTVVGVSALLNVSLNLILIPRIGIEGAALATMASFLATNLGYAYFVRRDLGITLIGRSTSAQYAAPDT